MKKTHQFLSILLTIICLTACQPSSPAPVAIEAASPTSAPLPIDTPVPPTETPIPPTLTPIPPTSTPIPPTLTPTITPPSLLSDLLTNVQIIETDNFDNMDNWFKWSSDSGTLTNGIFELTGLEGWMSGLELKNHLIEGQGVVVKYKTMKNKDFNSEFVLVSGEWETDSFRQFGIYNGMRPKADLYQGKNGLGWNNLNGNLTLKADTWYNLLLAIGKNGELMAVIWNQDNPTQRIIYHETIGKKWAGLDYRFQSKANIGETMFIDDFLKISFDEIK
jgi:hypothetical protein